MTAPTVNLKETAPFAADWAAQGSHINGAQPSFVKSLRQSGMARFQALGFPTPRQEAWRLTNVAPIAATAFKLPSDLPAGVGAADIAPYLYDGCARLVFLDGRFAPALSDTSGLPAGVVAVSLADALRSHPALVEPHLGRHGSDHDHPFIALNTAFVQDGAFIHVPRGVVAQTPILLLFATTAADQPTATYPRILVVAEGGSQATVIESYAGLAERAYFTCPVTEVVVGAGAVVDHYKVQKESTAAYHVAALQIRQERDSTFDSHAALTGGRLVRNDVNAVLAGEGGSCTLNGLYVVTGDQHVDNQMLVDHVAPHCTSFELYKGILDGRSRSVFNGRIHVHKGAQKTDAVQANRNLILSAHAIAHSNPQLEIFADDVRCTHGSTVGELDDDAVFYLRSRGIGADAARSILTYAFASDIVDRIKVPAVRTDLAAFLFDRLPRGEVVREAV